MATVTEFQPPEGLHPHEAPFLLGEGEPKDRSVRALMTACLEMADDGTMVFDPATRRPAIRKRDGASHTPFQELVADAVSGDPSPTWAGDIERPIKRRLATLGWFEDALGGLTPEGRIARERLIGYRDYLRKAMTDRLHMAAVEGALDRETEFAAGVGIIGIPNLARAIAMRLGDAPTGAMGAVFSFLGGSPSEQHAFSSRLTAKWPLAAFLAVIIIAINLLILLLMFIF